MLLLAPHAYAPAVQGSDSATNKNEACPSNRFLQRRKLVRARRGPDALSFHINAHIYVYKGYDHGHRLNIENSFDFYRSSQQRRERALPSEQRVIAEKYCARKA